MGGTCKNFCLRGPSIKEYAKAEAPDVICTGVPPAKSNTPSSAAHPEEFHVQLAMGS